MIIIVAANTVPGVAGVQSAPAQMGKPAAPTAQASASNMPSAIVSAPDQSAVLLQANVAAVGKAIANKELWTTLSNNAAFMSALPQALIQNGNTTAALANNISFVTAMCTDQAYLAMANQNPAVQDKLRQYQSESIATNPPTY